MSQPTTKQQELIIKIAALTRELHVVMSLPEKEEKVIVMKRGESFESSTPKLPLTDVNVNT